ncbi:MAG: hypothetical protein GY906_34425 [bacterium]|nr:hypothetical protein [bacterium]
MTLVQIALGADNLIIITIIAGKLPLQKQKTAVRWDLILAMVFPAGPLGHYNPIASLGFAAVERLVGVLDYRVEAVITFVLPDSRGDGDAVG